MRRLIASIGIVSIAAISSGSALAQARVIAVARLDATYHLTDMQCPLPGLHRTRVATSLAQTRESDITRGCYEIDPYNDVVVIYWFEDDPKYPRRKRIPLSAFAIR